MRLRHRVLLLLGALLLGVVVAIGVVAAGLLREVAAAAPADMAITVVAAQRLLWLTAAAIAALGVGVGGVASRVWLVAPLEQLARDTGDAGAEEISILRHSLQTLRQRAREADLDRGGRLDAIQALLDHAADGLAAADRLSLTGQLALGAAHELGSPLAIAVACVDSLRYGVVAALAADGVGAAETGAAAARYVDQIDEALSRVDAIVRELNAFGLPAQRAAAGGVGIARLEVTRVRQTVQATIALARLHQKCRRVALTLVGGDAVGEATAAIAPRHLEQIVLNLLINAADATANQGAVTVRLSLADTAVFVSVSDDGPGVPESVRAQIFDPFFTTKPDGVGSGLGLAVSRRLAQAAGGQLHLAPDDAHDERVGAAVPARGATFVLRLQTAR
mgnify:CR=1 FL=1